MQRVDTDNTDINTDSQSEQNKYNFDYMNYLDKMNTFFNTFATKAYWNMMMLYSFLQIKTEIYSKQILISSKPLADYSVYKIIAFYKYLFGFENYENLIDYIITNKDSKENVDTEHKLDIEDILNGLNGILQIDNNENNLEDGANEVEDGADDVEDGAVDVEGGVVDVEEEVEVEEEIKKTQ